jgi:hypothetical protein
VKWLGEERAWAELVGLNPTVPQHVFAMRLAAWMVCLCLSSEGLSRFKIFFCYFLGSDL